MKNFFRTFRNLFLDFYNRIKPIWLSHHPPCERFENHTLNIGKWRFCIGCFIGYPIGIGSFILNYFLIIPNYGLKLWLFGIGLSLFSIIILSLTSITEIKWIKIVQKISMGSGAGIILAYLLHLINPHNEITGIIVFWVILSSLFVPIGFFHYRTMTRTCDECKYKWDPKYCPVDYCLASKLENSADAEKSLYN